MKLKCLKKQYLINKKYFQIFIAFFTDFTYNKIKARVAQLVEQWIEDPRVTSSNLVLGNLNSIYIRKFCKLSIKT